MSSLGGYRTAISKTLLPITGTDIGNHPDIASLLANISRDPKTCPTPAPNWNLSLVLDMLTKPPFEPLEHVEDRELTLKTVFLLALASGKRRSELHALRHKVLHKSAWSEITFTADPAFIAKTELASNRGSKTTFSIPALEPLVESEDTPQRMLCPVRAVRIYLRRTEKYRGDRTKLFLAYKKGHKGDIHPNTISGWIRKTICQAHDPKTVKNKDLHRLRAKAHDVRGVAASLAFQKNCSLQSIMDACCWSSHNTFTSYYLKDMALELDDIYHLGPVVAAQQIV